jgi:acyl-CoA thioester hydrolase
VRETSTHVQLPRDARPVFTSVHRVTYVDTDAAQVVHHAMYLRYFEVARIEFLRAHGWDYAAWLAREKLGLPVAENWVKYRAPARFDDILKVTTWVARATRAYLRWEYNVTRDGVLLTEAFTITPCTTLDAAVRRVPVPLIELCLGAAFDPGAL